MSLQRWSAEGRLRLHKATRREILALLAAADRDLDDALTPGLSADRRFSIAYGSALKLASVALHAAGYRSVGAGHHEVTVRSLVHTLGPDSRCLVRYLDACRTKRNRIDYDGVGYATEADAYELASEVSAMRASVVDWLAATHPDLAP
jgi:hypothetical protein